MKKFINRLREKPEHERKRFAFATSLIVTLLIAGMWTSTFFRTEEQVVVVEESDGPFEALGREIAGAYGALKDRVADWRNSSDDSDVLIIDDELEGSGTDEEDDVDGVAPRVTNVSIE